MGKIHILDPTTKAKEQTITLVPRPESFRNLRIGLIDNTKYNSDKLWLKTATILEKEHGAKNHIIRSKRNASTPVPKEIIEEFMANCDVAIAGIGD